MIYVGSCYDLHILDEIIALYYSTSSSLFGNMNNIIRWYT